jgi:hypothetical protein
MIQLAVLDPMLYGAARAFDYLGFRGQEMLDRMGDGIIRYGLSQGYFERSNDPHQFVSNIVKFFLSNGYGSNVRYDQSGDIIDITIWNWRFLPLMEKLRNRSSYLISLSICITYNSVEKSAGVVGERISENVTSDGVYTIRMKVVPGATNTENTVIPLHPADFTRTKPSSQLNESVGLPVFEAFAYGLACGFEYLGAQAQLILDNVGSGMLEFMREESNVQLSDDLEDSLHTLSTFVTSGGLADRIEVQLSPSQVNVDFKNYHYLPVLKKLLNEGRSFSSCPFTLAARAIIRNKGLAVGGMKWQVSTEDAQLKMTTVNLTDQQFDENSVSSIMDQA